jgi:hypothetical protein
MAIEELDDLQAEAPPAKRTRFEGSEVELAIANDGMDDVYGSEGNTPAHDPSTKTETEVVMPVVMEAPITPSGGIPGLGLLGRPSGVHKTPLVEGM